MTAPKFNVEQPTPYGWKPDFFGPYSEGMAYRVMAGLIKLAPGRVFRVEPVETRVARVTDWAAA